ncbi:MAG: hypothetical protein EU540_05600 [Promethearchaeota archaeon]|nr:MAG: hypothetical protein EU540_05600 [Candidatus Lokiarchaeota archaeon]
MIKQKINKKQKSNRILLIISLLFILPIFINFLEMDLGFYNYADNNMENLDNDYLRNSNVYYRGFSGDGYDIFVSGDHAFIADGSLYGGLVVIDISDPTNPGSPIYESTDDSTFGIYVSGDHAYMGCAGAGLAVIDISDPTHPGTPVYEDTYGFANGIYVSGDYAYVADGNAGLAVLDISNPTDPEIPKYEPTSGYAYDVYVSGNYAYVADGSTGLAVLDISNPTNPGTAVYANTDGISIAVYVEGNYAYVADSGSGLAVIDISDPTNPGTPVYADTDGSAYAVYVDGDYAYVADYHKGIAVIDISDPTNPSKIAQGNLGENVYSICIGGNYAFLGGDGLYAVEISELNSPLDLWWNQDTTGNSQGVFVSGDYAYVADGASGLAVIDISDPTTPGAPQYSNTAGDAEDVVVSGDYAYIADGGGGLAVIDVSDPTTPGTAVRRDTTGDSRGIFVRGDYAFIADGGSGLAIIDISNPTSPGAPIYKDDGYLAKSVYIEGDYAYLSAGSGILTIDISDPITPGASVYLSLGGDARDIYVRGDYAYLVIYNDIVTVDISDPTNPTLIDKEQIYHTVPEGIFVSGEYAYTAEDYGSMGGYIKIWDISNPAHISFVDSLYIGDTYGGDGAFESFVTGNYIYVADSGSGLLVCEVRERVDTKDPTITQSPSDKVIEAGYTGESLSWRATDTNPNTYTIELEGDGIVAGPTAWLSGSLVTYNIPEGLSVGEYDYTINFTDDHGFYATDSVKVTVQDTENPVISDTPEDLKVLSGYTGQSFSWTATDPNPNTYSIELAGSGIVTGPTFWSSGVAVTYNIPDGLSLGEYFYTINFTDDYDHFTTDTVKFTVYEPDDPVITYTPIDILVGPTYTGLNFSWTATDANPDTYTIELQGAGIVAGPTAWSSGVGVTYDIPDGIKNGEHYFTINFTDDFDNYATDTVKLTIQDAAPQITNAPDDMIVLSGYADLEFSWTATDAEDPDTYTIELAGTGTIAGPTSWSSGVAVIYDIPNGLSLGEYFYTINFTDETGNYVTDEVKLTVQEDSEDPVITSTPEDYECFSGYSDVCFFWIATDAHPATFTVTHEEQGILAGPTPWTSGDNVSFIIPEGLSVGEHVFTINFTDLAGNFAIDNVKLRIQEENPVEPPPAIPFGSSFLIFMTISIIGLILIQKRKKQ